MLKGLWAFFIPGGVVFGLALGFLRPHGLPHWTHTPIAALPYVVVGFGAIYGWFLSSSRLILSLLVLALADRGLALMPAATATASSLEPGVLAALAFLLPLNLLALSLVKDEALSTARGVLRLIPILAQPFLVLWLCLPEQAEWLGALDFRFVPESLTYWSGLPQPSLLAFLGAILLLAVRLACERNPLDAGTLWALIACWTAFAGLRRGWAPTNFFTAAGLILFVTLVQASYRTAYRDALTGLLGRQAYEESITRLGATYAVAIVGFDQLKHYGNHHGKSIRDQILRLVAPMVQTAAAGGLVYRLGGEELTVVFAGKSATDTLAQLECIRKEVEQSVWHLRGRDRVWPGSRPGTEALPLTASIGVAEGRGGRTELNAVTKAAYRALYDAKGQGGNLVRRGHNEPPPARPARVETGHIVAYSEMDY
jgi:diguanylate cyclase (GGDEF)-like protein